jgi:WD40 repeat protein
MSESLAAREHTYAAFISYSHRDEALAKWLRRKLQRLGRGPTQRRALNVYLDTSEMGANPDLWESVCKSMDDSAHLVVVLSPEAANSPWVRREVDRWVDTHPSASVLLVLARGTLAWDNEAKAFSSDSDVLPPKLRRSGVFENEPLFVDLRDFDRDGPRSAVLHDRAITLAAAVHGVPRSRLADDDRREVTRARRFRRAAVAGLALLAVASSGATLVAIQQRQEARRQAVQARADRKVAIEQRNRAVASSLGSASKEQSDNPALSLALAVEGYDADPGSVDSLAALLQAKVDYARATLQPQTAQFRVDGSDALALNSNGRIFAAETGDGVGVFDSSNGRLLRDLPLPETSAQAVAFSPDDFLMAVGNADGLRVYRSADDFTDLTSFKHNYYVTGLAFSSTLPVLASCSDFGVWLFDTTKLAARPHRLKGPRRPDRCEVAFSPDGKRLATLVDDFVTVWRVSDSTQVARLYRASVKNATGLAFGTGDDLFVGGAGVRGFYYRRYHSLWGPTRRDTYYRPLALTPDGSRLVTGEDTPYLEIYDTDLEAEVQRVTVAPGRVSSVAISADGSTLASSGESGDVQIFDLDTDGRLGMRRFGRESYGVRAVAVGRGDVFAVGGEKLRFFDTAGTRVRDMLIHPHNGTAEISTVAYSPDGHYLVVADGDHLQLWNADTQTMVWKTTPGSYTSYIGSAAFSPDGTLVAVSGYRGEAYVWDATTGQQKAELSSGTTAPGLATTFVDDHLLAGAYGRDGLVLWDVDTGETVRSVHVPAGVYSFAHDPTSHRIAVGTGAGTVFFVDDATLAQVGMDLTGHRGRVSSVAFSPDGKRLLSSGQEGSVRLWDLASRRQLVVLDDALSYGGGESQAVFTPDGTGVLLADEEAQYWPDFLSPGGVCAEVQKYVTADMLAPYLPAGWETRCDYSG